MSHASWISQSDNMWGIDRSKPLRPQITSIVVCFALVVGGPALALVPLQQFPPLLSNRTMLVGALIGTIVGFAASFAIWREQRPPGIELAKELFVRAGLGFAMMALAAGLFGIVNGFATPVVAREVPVVGKRVDGGSYLVAARAWPGSSAVIELVAPYQVYAAVNAPVIPPGLAPQALDTMAGAGHVRLALGEGRLGLDWLLGVAPR